MSENDEKIQPWLQDVVSKDLSFFVIIIIWWACPNIPSDSDLFFFTLSTSLLTDTLSSAGIRTTFDRSDLLPGLNIEHWMKEGISKADYVICIGTPLFLHKLQNHLGFVGFEVEETLEKL